MLCRQEERPYIDGDNNGYRGLGDVRFTTTVSCSSGFFVCRATHTSVYLKVDRYKNKVGIYSVVVLAAFSTPASLVLWCLVCVCVCVLSVCTSVCVRVSYLFSVHSLSPSYPISLTVQSVSVLSGT